ncbi:MAG: hypothetical protein COA54_07745 [Thiotrichaceae bacterium]|nr:MAG: hypothetical protein COA54_07745 [Thiotrichaceae bacterium]
MNKETQKFADWFEQEKMNGLVDIKFFTGDLSSSTTEHFFREANALNEAEVTDVGDCSETFKQFELATPMT